jgi:NADH dehydrogenase
MTQITVFGASGFIGRHIVRRLARDGFTVRAPSRDPEKALILKPMGDVGQIVPMLCNIRNDASVAAAIGDSGAVINLLGILYEKGRNTFQSVHVEAAARITRLSREQGAQRLIHMSALGADKASSSAYARSKAAGEDAVRAFFPDASILRPSIVFGPEDHFFNMFAALARLSPVLPLIGGGHTKFQPVYAGDVAEAVRRILRDGAHGHVYELGGPAVYTFRQLLELMLEVIGRHRRFINLPWKFVHAQAFFMEFLPHPMLTRDQIELLKTDNVLRDRMALTFRDLGIAPVAPELILPAYLGRFRRGGVEAAQPATAP